MKVCILTTAFPRWKGDTRGVFVFEAARAITRQGIQVRVVAMHNPGAQNFEVMDDIEVFRPRYLPDAWEVLQKSSAGLPQAWKEKPLSRLALLPFLITHSLAVGKLARDCDLIHANWTLSAGAAWVSRFIHHKPFIVTVQGSDIFQAAQIPVFKGVTRHVLQKADQVVALSGALAAASIQLGISDSKVKVVPNGVDITQFTLPDESLRKPVILFVGSLIERKGVRYLIDAFRLIMASHPDYSLVVIGEGPQRESLEKLAADFPEGKVAFLGALSQAEIKRWMQTARVFVLPSLEEGQGVVLVEALACGTPCVASNVGGIPDVIIPEVGGLVPPRDSKALADAIDETIVDLPNWQLMSRNARSRAENTYNWDRIASEIVQIYRQVINDREEK